MLTPEIARSWYPHDDAVHGFDHILRVYHMCEVLAQAEGADLEIVRAAALLHDAQGRLHNDASPPDTQTHANHHHSSAAFAGEVLADEGWPEERIMAVQHCIRAHRFRHASEAPATLEARVLFDADKLDAIGAIGVARAIAFAAQRGQPAYAPPSDRFLQSGEKTPGEVHSAYHEYLFKLRKLSARLFTPSGKRLAEARHQFLTDYFVRLIAEIDGNA